MKNGNILFWIWLSEALGVAGRSFRSLISQYENPYDLFHADTAELERIPDLSDRARRALCDKNLKHASEILESCERSGIRILCYGDEQYPNALREIASPPVLLYYRGILPDFNHRLCIGVVGTRRMSAYGLRSAYKISYGLALAGAVTVSGLAAGIDGVAAAATLAAGGSTVAILGCGVDVVYPRYHDRLMEAVCRTGAVMSEYPPGTRPANYHFPVRNRLISGISQGTLVVEAGIGSGSLITAKDAILQGREVFALPANVGSVGAEGTNGLLRDGATLVLGAADILRPYQYVYAGAISPGAVSETNPAPDADLAYLERLGVIETVPRQKIPAETGLPSEESRRETPTAASRTSRRTQPNETPPAPEAEEEENRNAEHPSDEVLDGLTDCQRAILEAIPESGSIPADRLSSLGYPFGDVIAALTVLEILGLVRKLPGALYTRA